MPPITRRSCGVHCRERRAEKREHGKVRADTGSAQRPIARKIAALNFGTQLNVLKISENVSLQFLPLRHIRILRFSAADRLPVTPRWHL